jgi:hypothetical protein
VTEVRRRIDRARELLRMRLADEYGTPEALPPVESLFAVLRHLAPTPDQARRTRGRLEAAA